MEFQIDASGHVALGGRRGLALHTGNLGTSFSGRHGGAMPETPAPTTTTSKSRVSSNSVMGSGAMRKLGVPSAARVAPDPVSAIDALFG